MFINKTNLTKQQQQQRTKTYHSYVLPHPFSQNPTKDTKSVLATIQNGFILKFFTSLYKHLKFQQFFSYIHTS